jgi:uncharacterized protein with HEPN domain
VPHKSWKIRIHDILTSVETIEKYTEGMSFDDFVADRKTVDAVMRHLIVLGEAAARMPDQVCEDHPEIPWYEMRGMRNFVVHEYFNVNDKVLWNTIKENLPPLILPLKQLLD